MSQTPSAQLIEAVVRHDLSRVQTLLSRGADPNAHGEDGWRPLHHAIGQLGVGGTIEFITLLLEHGANVNEWDTNHHETPILSAMYYPEVEAVRVLLESGADPNVRRSTGESPLDLAVEQQSLDVAALLLRHGAGKTIDEWNLLRGLTPLGIAARQFDIPMIKLLLREGADPQALDEYEETARDKLPAREKHDPQEWDRVMEMLGRATP